MIGDGGSRVVRRGGRRVPMVSGGGIMDARTGELGGVGGVGRYTGLRWMGGSGGLSMRRRRRREVMRAW